MTTNHPRLPPEVAERAFVARNGQLGLHLTDVQVYVDQCQADGISIFGWEVWIINHLTNGEFSSGSWTGLIPKLDGTFGIIGGEGGGNEVKAQCAAFRPDAEIPQKWIPYLRVNITTDAE